MSRLCPHHLGETCSPGEGMEPPSPPCLYCVNWTIPERTCPSLRDLSWTSYWKCALTMLSIWNPGLWVVWAARSDAFWYCFKWHKLYCKCNQKAKALQQIAGVNLGQKEAGSYYRKVKLWLISCECSSEQSFFWITSLLQFHLKASVSLICCLCPTLVLLKP